MEEALALEAKRRAVYVVFDGDDAAREMQQRLPAHTSIKCETLESLCNFDLESMTLRRAWPNCVVLVDHYVIEKRFGAMLEMLHRFDAPLAVGPECQRCQVMMRPGQAFMNTVAESDEGTCSNSGPAKLVHCWKCPDCGFSKWPMEAVGADAWDEVARLRDALVRILHCVNSTEHRIARQALEGRSGKR